MLGHIIPSDWSDRYVGPVADQSARLLVKTRFLFILTHIWPTNVGWGCEGGSLSSIQRKIWTQTNNIMVCTFIKQNLKALNPRARCQIGQHATRTRSKELQWLCIVMWSYGSFEILFPDILMLASMRQARNKTVTMDKVVKSDAIIWGPINGKISNWCFSSKMLDEF